VYKDFNGIIVYILVLFFIDLTVNKEGK